MKELLLSIAKSGNTFLYPVTFPLVNGFARWCAWSAATAYRFSMLIDWGRNPTPEWMDHRQDLYWYFHKFRKSSFLERGTLPRVRASVFLDASDPHISRRTVKVLDVCCGDGFYSEFFFSEIASHICFVDLDAEALKRARANARSSDGIRRHYMRLDIEKADLKSAISSQMPDVLDLGGFDVVLFNAAIEHFRDSQLHHIFENIKDVTKPTGFVAGYTLVESEGDPNRFAHHELFFKDEADLKGLLSRFLPYVETTTSIGAGRINLYFFGYLARPVPAPLRGWPNTETDL